jgi:glycosyltransferase involved in cell wall biosynthesis
VSALSVGVVLENADFQGGMERQAHRLAKGLAARGAKVVLVTTFTPERYLGSSPKDPPRKEQRDGYEIVRVPCYRWWSGEAVRARFALSLAKTFFARAVQVVYAVQFQAALHLARAARGGEWATVLKLACGGSYGDMAQATRWPEKTVYRDLVRVDRFACLSEQVRAEVAAAGLPAERCLIVRNGVDRTVFSKDGAKAALPPGRSILFIGRQDGQKRISVLLQAFAKIAARIPDARLVSVGRGPEEERLKELARELGVADRVSFLGERRDVPDLLRAASVFCLPSAAEGMPNALLEALSTGVPSVATEIPGTTDVVRHEKEALLVPVDDVPALEQALERLLEDPALAARLGAAGAERIAREFDMERVTDMHLALFQELAQKKPPVRRSLGRLRLTFARTLVTGWFSALGRRLS